MQRAIELERALSNKAGQPMSETARQEPGPWFVFISHAGTDTWVARQIAALIEARGASTFLDEAHVSVGEDFEDRILHALDQADELLGRVSGATCGES